MNSTITDRSARRHRGARGLRARVGSLRAGLTGWRGRPRTAGAELELAVADQWWISVDACISTIDGAALVHVDTSALDPSRRCRVTVNDGAVYDAIPDEADHNLDQVAGYLAELRRQEVSDLTRSAAAARVHSTDLPEWPYVSVDPDDLGRGRPVITLDQIVRWGGTVLTEDEIDRVVAAIPQSSIPDAIADIVAAITTDHASAGDRHDADPEADDNAA